MRLSLGLNLGAQIQVRVSVRYIRDRVIVRARVRVRIPVDVGEVGDEALAHFIKTDQCVRLLHKQFVNVQRRQRLVATHHPERV